MTTNYERTVAMLQAMGKWDDWKVRFENARSTHRIRNEVKKYNVEKVAKDLSLLEKLLEQTDEQAKRIATVEEVEADELATELREFDNFLKNIDGATKESNILTNLLKNSRKLRTHLKNETRLIRRGARFMLWRYGKRETKVLQQLKIHTNALPNNVNVKLLDICNKILEDAPKVLAGEQWILDDAKENSKEEHKVVKDIDAMDKAIDKFFKIKLSKRGELTEDKVTEHIQKIKQHLVEMEREGIDLKDLVATCYEHVQNLHTALRRLIQYIKNALGLISAEKNI